MDFKEWLQLDEMMHLSRVRHKLVQPFAVKGINGKKVVAIDMKFEYYPTDADIKLKLMRIDAKFFGDLPNNSGYLVFDGNKLHVLRSSHFILPIEFTRLPNDWWDYAIVEYDDGTIKQPIKGDIAHSKAI